MGKNNKARRAAKAKKRAKRGTPRSRGAGRFEERYDGEFYAGPDPVDPQLEIAALWFELENASGRDGLQAEELAGVLASHPQPVVDSYAERAFADIIGGLWQAGWQPAELRRQVRRTCSAAAARLIELAILAEHDRRSGPADERWRAQLHDFSMRKASTRGSWFLTWRSGEKFDRVKGYQVAGSVLATVTRLPALDVLIPPPGASSDAKTSGIPSASTSGDPMLARIRKLLSKAESTEFEAEAMSLTGKAQELMTRHAIDMAMVTAPDVEDVPRMIRLPIDAPYADAKSILLAVIASANRSRAVYLDRLEMSTVVGHAGDLSVIELMFTSLLVQAQNALAEAGRQGGFGARARSQSFRSSFFIAYGQRIKERLQATNDEVFAEAGEDAEFLPVLRAREDAVEEFMEQRFGDTLTTGSVRGGYDMAGSAYGRRAADDAELDSGELLW